MQINLKTTILLSSLLAVAVNVGQFLVQYPKTKDNFFTTWAYADTATPVPTITPAKLSMTPVGIPAQPVTAATAPSVSTATADSAAVAARLKQAGFRSEFAPLYLQVQRQTGTPWQLLAAVHKIESGQSGNTSRSSGAGAVGPMQFMPSTFRSYAADGDGNGTKDITDVDDAMLAAGKYLAANGAAAGNYQNALYHYNHSATYVSTVRSYAARLGL